VETLVQSIPTSDLSQLTSFDSGGAAELTVYFDPSEPGLQACFYDALEREYLVRGLRVSHRLRATESFGRSRHVHNDRSADFDPPMVVVAVDAVPTIDSALASVSSLGGEVFVTLAPTEVVTRTSRAVETLGSAPAELVIHCRRGRSRDDPHGVGGVLEELRRQGIVGATALGRGEGTLAGQRHRPRLLSSSPDGPMMVVAIDQANAFARATRSLLALPQVALITVKPIVLCKWHGRSQPPPAPSADRPAWSRITLYTGGRWLDWHPEHHALIQRLRKLGAPGVTTLRGTDGYALGDPLRHDHGWFRHRTAPMVTTIVDTPDHTAQWLRAIDDVTADDGLATHEFISAHRLM
jgi:PII-like signaling protein